MSREMDDRAIHSLPESSNFECFHPPYFMWFKIMTPKFQTCIGQANIARQGKVPQSQTTQQ
jgi:hypothetical protein